MPGEDTLHGVVCGVARGCRAALIASRAQVIVVTYQALVPSATEIGLHTCITAHTWRKECHSVLNKHKKERKESRNKVPLIYHNSAIPKNYKPANHQDYRSYHDMDFTKLREIFGRTTM